MQLGSEDDDRSYVEDRRGQGGGGGGMRVGMGVGGTLVVLALSILFKRNLFNDLGTPAQHSAPGQTARDTPGGQARVSNEKELETVAVRSFNNAQKMWAQVLPASGTAYRPARLVVFWDGTESGCGAASAGMGPFYCPPDQGVYIDLGFYRELSRRFGAPGDFAQAYVLAHEMGHHVQNLLGIEARVRQAQRAHPRDRNQLSVLMELQADCFAGIWGRSLQQQKKLDPGDIEEGMRAASAVGDDSIQKAATGSIHPESFTHGTAAQRVQWFRRGLQSGRVERGLQGARIEDCDTFGAGANVPDGP